MSHTHHNFFLLEDPDKRRCHEEHDAPEVEVTYKTLIKYLMEPLNHSLY